MPSPKHPVVRLLPNRHRRAKAGHPWVYSNEVAMTAAAKALEPGGLVTLVSDHGEAFGTAMFNPHSLIAARRLDPAADAAIDADFLSVRIGRALALRERLFDAPFYRLVHAEADGLPGLVIDGFDGDLVLQLNAAGMDGLRAPLLAALDRVLAPRRVLLRNDSAARALEGLPQVVEVARGEAGPVELREGGCAFFADPAGGQKTGWFYDQRDSRAFTAHLARGLRVLDVYCHSGGFAVRAAAGGAAAVLGIDRSAPALDLAGRAADANGVAENCRFRQGEAFAELERLASAGERFGMVIADPPAFVRSKKALAAGARGYRKLARLAAALVAPEGFLFAASCSHNMPAEVFAEQVGRGLAESGRTGRILRSAGAAPDHPVHPMLPETAYLKTLTLQLD